MPDVLIRDVPIDDLVELRSAAAARGTSMQQYLQEAISAQATYIRRQAALVRAAERLRDRPEVPPEERRAVLDAIQAAHAERAEALVARQDP